MNISGAITSQLEALNDSLELGLTNRDGTDRIYPGYQKMADKAYPAICYDYENYAPDFALDGAAGTATFDLHILCCGQDYDSADGIAQQLSAAMDSTRGTWGTMTVQGCFLEEIATEHFVDTDMETILYYVSELTMKVAIVL
jgi:hypothetical protein